MQTVIETESYLRAAKDAGMAEDERALAVDLIATDPEGSDVMQGTGGVRKARLAGRGKGKSGGYRVVWYFGGGDIPLFLLTVFGPRTKWGREGEPHPRRAQRAPLADGDAAGKLGREVNGSKDKNR